MGEWKSDYAEIIVRVVPVRHGVSQASEVGDHQGKSPSVYDALIYTDLGEPALPADLPSQLKEQPGAVAGKPLVAVEQVRLRWSRYDKYLASFVDGAKDPYLMRQRLIETMSPGLEVLFSDQPLADRPVRVWWSNESPELEDLPWELVAYAGKGAATGQFSFVRGQPPEKRMPVVSVGNRLRLAFIHDPDMPPGPLPAALESITTDIEVTAMTEEPRQALKRVVAEGHELVHIVADGVVSMAYEGVLHVHDSNSPHLPPSELSALLRGSRVAVLALSAADGLHAEEVQTGKSLVPSACRAFAYLGRSSLPLPSIVAPLGPLMEFQVYDFWQGFYSGLAETLLIEEAMARGRAGGPPVAMALFLRQPHGRLFRRQTMVSKSAEREPAQAQAELEISKELVDRLEVISASYGGQSESVTEFIEQESARQIELAEDLDPWLDVAEDEL